MTSAAISKLRPFVRMTSPPLGQHAARLSPLQFCSLLPPDQHFYPYFRLLDAFLMTQRPRKLFENWSTRTRPNSSRRLCYAYAHIRVRRSNYKWVQIVPAVQSPRSVQIVQANKRRKYLRLFERFNPPTSQGERKSKNRRVCWFLTLLPVLSRSAAHLPNVCRLTALGRV